MAAGVRRRDLLGLGTAVALGAPRARAAGAESFRTPLCDLLGIEHPLLQAPMSGVATPEMVAAVGAAGGLGILPGVATPPEEIRRQIRRVRELSDRPFGVNLLLHTDLLPPVDVSRVPESVVQSVQTVLNRFRATLGIPAVTQRPPSAPDVIGAAIEVILEERVPVFSVGLGKPGPELVGRFHARGAKVIAMAATLEDARELAASGVDAIIAQGGEAGGHRSTWVKKPTPQHANIGTLVLVPQLVDALPLPVIAAGGIVTGRQAAAALVLGAAGVLLGTRFVATRESAAPSFYKDAVIGANSDGTTVTDAFTGLYARVLRNAYTDEYAASGAPVLPAVVQQIAARDVTSASAAQGRGDYFPMYAGQGAGLVRDLPGAGEVVSRIMEEARTALRAPPGTFLRR